MAMVPSGWWLLKLWGLVRRWRNGVRVLIVWTWTGTRIAIDMMWRRRMLVKGRTCPCLRISTMTAHDLDTST